MRKTMTIDPHRFGTASQAITEAKRQMLDTLVPAAGVKRNITVVKCDYADKMWTVELEVRLDRADQYFR